MIGLIYGQQKKILVFVMSRWPAHLMIIIDNINDK